MRILIGTDGSSQAALGARWVAQLPLEPTDEVTVVAVAEKPMLLGGWGLVLTPQSEELRAMAWEQGRSVASAAVEAAVEALAPLACRVRPEVREGHPLEELNRLATESAVDLLVVGPHGRGRLETILLGSVSQGLLNDMVTAVLVVRGRIAPPTKVLLAADGSANSEQAARYLARFPLPETARVDVLAVSSRKGGSAAAIEGSQTERVLDATLEILAGGRHALTRQVRWGDAKQQILAAAEELDSDLVVIGARGLGGFRGLVLGSVARVLAKAARCSVLVVPDKPPRSARGEMEDVS